MATRRFKKKQLGKFGDTYKEKMDKNLQCVKEELSAKLSLLEQQPHDYVIPELFTKSHCTDTIILVVEDQEIYASKRILKLASPVFQSMFDSDFREKNMKSIELPGKTRQEIVLLLSCLYPNILEQIEDDPVELNVDILDVHFRTPKANLAFANISGLLRQEKKVIVRNCNASAKELRDFFGKLKVKTISLNRKTGKATVGFDDVLNTLYAYCMDGEVVNGCTIDVQLCTDSEDAEDYLSDLFVEDDSTTVEDTWEATQVSFTVQEKLSMLLKLADEYQIESIIRLCEEKYLSCYHGSVKDTKDVPVENTLKLLHISEKYNMANLCKEMVDRAVKTNLKILQKEQCFEKLSFNTKFKICRLKLKKIGSGEGYMRKTPDTSTPINTEKKTFSHKNDIIDDSDFLDGKNPYMSVVLHVGSDTLYASKEVLALSSPVLRDLIDSVQTDPVTLEFPDHNKDDFLCLLRSIHPNCEPVINKKNARGLLKLAEKFQLRQLLDDCDTTLESELSHVYALLNNKHKDYPRSAVLKQVAMKRLKLVNKFLSMAVRYKLPKLQATSCGIISTLEYDQLMKFVEKKGIPQDVMFQAMSPRILSLEDYISGYRLKEMYQKLTDDDDESLCRVPDNPSYSFVSHTEYDICLVVQGEHLYIDKDVMSLASPFFRREIEKQQDENIPTIVCSGKKVDDMVSLLKCIHPNILAKVNEENAANILQFVDEYEMSALSKVCEDSLIKNCKGLAQTCTIVDYIAKSERYKMQRLRKACEERLSEMCSGNSSTWRENKLREAAILNLILSNTFQDDHYSSRYYLDDDLYYDSD